MKSHRLWLSFALLMLIVPPAAAQTAPSRGGRFRFELTVSRYR